MVIVQSLITAFVIAFVALCALGHVLLLAALFKEPRPPGPKQAGTDELADAAWRLT
jgi:hypothetical protein